MRRIGQWGPSVGGASACVRLPLMLAVLVAGTALPSLSGWAADSEDSADWPCPQPRAPNLTAGLFWEDPPIPADAHWQDDAALVALIDAVTAHGVSVDEGSARLAAFAEQLPQAARARVLPVLFAGLVARIDEQHRSAIASIERLGRRQAAIAAKLRTLDTATDEDSLEQRDLALRAYRGQAQMMGALCHVPTELGARLGAYARVLHAAL